MNPVFDQIGTSVFEAMSRFAREHEAINLGQGFPDDPGPEDVRQGGGSGGQRLESIPADAWPPRAAVRRRRPLQAVSGSRTRYQSTARPNEAYAVLAPALEGFTPTPEMPEIAEAQALMERLA